MPATPKLTVALRAHTPRPHQPLEVRSGKAFSFFHRHAGHQAKHIYLAVGYMHMHPKCIPWYYKRPTLSDLILFGINQARAIQNLR